MDILKYLIICMLFPCTNSQTFSSTFSGCVTKNDQNQQLLIADNETLADRNWWYKCAGTKLIAQGCVVNGQRYDIGDQFDDYLNSFYGRCDSVDGKYLKTTILGCVDMNGDTVEPGYPYLVNKYFWANCTSTRKSVNVPGVGNVEMDVIGRKIIGCNDGTYDMVKDNNNLVDIKVPAPREYLAGIGLVCKLNGSYPRVEPVVCLIGSPKDENYKAISTGCYTRFLSYAYFCTIKEHDFQNGTFEYTWELGWNESTPENLDTLKSKGFRNCGENATSGNVIATTPATVRRRRHDPMIDEAKNPLMNNAITRIARMNRLPRWLEASSTFVLAYQ